MAFIPGYLNLLETGELDRRILATTKMMENCALCPRKCRVNRQAGETGHCNTGKMAIVASYHAHMGEEAPLVGRHGSGTIFFSNCNLLCSFCQNFDISHHGQGRALIPNELAGIMLELAGMGCHNINFVTPSHVIPQILTAVKIAAENGLTLPLVYNSSGYDRISALQLLADVIDIYMPDFKFWEEKIAEKTCQAKNYRKIACNALMEMHRQVGDLCTNRENIAEKGLLIRHLVLPHNQAGTARVMKFIAEQISRNTYVNIMPQYRPLFQAGKTPEINRAVTTAEFNYALLEAEKAGIKRLDKPRRFFFLP
ncbi:radical SAM protein [Desulfobacterales bacterium HSG17]|nr:radical SAM protein [Desulfobacterales bacterium HSG17]